MLFKKPFQIKGQNQLRNSDVRKLKEDIRSAFPDINDDMMQSIFSETPYIIPSPHTQKESDVVHQFEIDRDENVNDANVAIRPSKKASSSVLRFKLFTHSKETVFVYKINNPIFFRFGESGDLFPTVYTLWNVPQLCPSLGVGKAVLPNLLNGADLMIPGISLSSLELMPTQCAKNSVVSARLVSTNAPIAVGRICISIEELRKARSDEVKGKAMLIHHLFGDELWAFGDRSPPPEMNLLTTENEEQQIQGAGDQIELQNDVAIVESSLNQSLESSSKDADNHIDILPEDMDKLLEETLFTAIQLKLKEKMKPSFPISSSVFYDTYMIPCRPAKTLLDIKKSTFKKLGKFLKAYEKKGILKTKEKQGETYITSVNDQHPILESFVAPRHIAGDSKSSATSTSQQPTNNSRPKSGSSSSETPDVKLTCLYRAQSNSKVLSIIATGSTGSAAENISSSVLLTGPEVKSLVNRYIHSKNLVSRTAKNVIILDDLLSEIVLKKQEKQEGLASLPREILLERFLEAMSPHYQLSIPESRKDQYVFGDDKVLKINEFLNDDCSGVYEDESKPCSKTATPTYFSITAKGKLKPMQMVIKKRAGGKLVTILSGTEAFGIDAQRIADELKILCATSVSCGPLSTGPANSGLSEISIQGNKVFDVCTFLKREYGIPCPPLSNPKNEKRGKWNITTPFYYVVT